MIPIVETKLYSPRWPTGLISRPGLIERLAAGVRGRLTIVTAPPDYPWHTW